MTNKQKRLLFSLLLGIGMIWFLLTSLKAAPTLAIGDPCIGQSSTTDVTQSHCGVVQSEVVQQNKATLSNQLSDLLGIDISGLTKATDFTLEDAYERVLAAGAYSFSAESEQTLLPRPLPSMIGETDQRVDIHIEGEVTLPGKTILSLSMFGGGIDPTPVALMQEGSETYLLRDGEKILVDNPAGISSPTGDFLNYLAAAENVQLCETEDAPFDTAVACYTYDLNGQKFADHVRQQMQAQIDNQPASRPPDIDLTIAASPVLMKMNGHGKVWLDTYGLPLRQRIDFEIPEVDESYDSQVRMVIDYQFDETAVATVIAIDSAKSFFLPPSEIIIEQVETAAPHLVVLFITLTLGWLLIVLRKRHWMYRLFAVTISFVLIATPVLQIIGYAIYSHRIAYAAETETSFVDMITLEEETAVATQPAAIQSNNNILPFEPDFYCGRGSNGDRDADGLADDAEYCLGTNPNLADSDYDGISDGQEVSGMTITQTNKTWYSNPLNADSNGDGINDGFEWDLSKGGYADSWDLDDDKIPNLWDFDDDGDGVSDNNDLSPNSRTKYFTPITSTTKTTNTNTSITDTFNFNIAGKYNGYIYIDIQVQPKNMDHIRYGLTPLDWGFDNKGQIQELNQTTDDITLIPMLSVETNAPPSRDLAQQYDVTPLSDTDGDSFTQVIMPLSIVGSGGSAEAFSARLVYGPDTLNNSIRDTTDIIWKNPRIIWIVQGKIDTTNADGSISEKTLAMHQYDEPSFRITGWQVTKSGEYTSAIIGTPSIPDNERQLFQLLFGMSSAYLNNQDIDINEVKARFNGANTPIAERWGVTATVKFDFPNFAYSHYEAGVVDLNNRIKSFLSNNYSFDKPNVVIIAGESNLGLYGQDDLGTFQPDLNKLGVNLFNITLATQRSLNLHMRTGWDIVAGGDAALKIADRYKTAFDAAQNDLKDQYPGITSADLLALTESFYATWEGGRSRLMNIDGLSGGANNLTDLEIYEQIYSEPKDRYNDPANISTLPGYLVEVGHFAQKGSGLIFKGGSAQTWQYMQSNANEADMMGFTAATTVFFNKVQNAFSFGTGGATTFGNNTSNWNKLKEQSEAWIFGTNAYKGTSGGLMLAIGTIDTVISTVSKIKKGIKAASAATGVTKAASVMNKMMKTTSKLGKIVKSLGAVMLAIEIGLTLGKFFAKGDYSGQAIAAMLAAIIMAVALFVISLNPIGAVIIAILGIIDLIFSFVFDDFTISGWIGKQIANFLYQEKPLTEIENFNLLDRNMTLADPSMGYEIGNRYIITDTFEGIIRIPKPKDYFGDMTNDEIAMAALTGGQSLINKANIFGMIQGSPDNDEVLRDSWICGEFEIQGWASSRSKCPHRTADYKLSTIPRNAESWTFQNPMTITVEFNRSGSNIEIPLQTKITAQTVSQASIPMPPFTPLALLGRISWTKTNKLHLPGDLPDDKKWKPVSIYIDVLPAEVDHLWHWGTTSDGYILANHDPDGDGMTTKEEIDARLGSSAYADFKNQFVFFMVKEPDHFLAKLLASWDQTEKINMSLLTSFCNSKPAYATLCDLNKPVFWLTPDSDGDGLSDKFEYDNQGTLGTNFALADTDSDGISDGFEYRIGTNINNKDSDGDGLNDNVEVYHPDLNNNWTGGWDIILPKYGAVGPNGRYTITVTVFSDPLNKDTDGDGLSDFAEKENGTSPTAYNRAPRITLTGAPIAVSPDGISAVYVRPGDLITLTTNLNVFPPFTVSSTLTLNVPGVFGFPYTTKLNGSRSVPNTGVTYTPRWEFANNVLQPWEYLYASTTSNVGYIPYSVVTTATLSLPFGGEGQKQEATQMIVVDVERPHFNWMTPNHGEEIGGGISSIVIGGTSSDVTTWVDHIDLTLPFTGTQTITRSGSLSPWAYTWQLPSDGIYTLYGRSTDFVGNISNDDSVQVMIDNTAPSVNVNFTDGAVYGPPQDSAVITITLSGSATENLSGLTRVQISTDGGPWREVWTLDTATLTNTTFTDHNTLFRNRATYATWDAVWTLPNVETVQGYHSLRVRAFDQAGNWPTYLERNIIIDVMPPTDELVNRAYLYEFPHVPANQAHTFNGVVNDVGNVPQPSRPAELVGTLDSMDDATIWLGLSDITENDAGVNVAWIGDFNGDRRGDLLVGLPAAANGDGRVAVVYGRSGNWPVPNEQEMLAGTETSFIGTTGAAIGAHVTPAGDVNGDGLADLLIGDPTNNRVFLIFGQNGYFGQDIVLDGSQKNGRTVFTVPSGKQIGDNLGMAGDVNGDGFADILIGAAGTENAAYLILGQSLGWLATMQADAYAAAKIYNAGTATFFGIGDVNGDFRDEFAVGKNNKLYIFEGKGSFAPQAGWWHFLGSSEIDSFSSADANPAGVALGDVNGDNIDDFIFSNGSSQTLVFGDNNLKDASWTTHSYSYGAGFLAAPGDVDNDGKNDILIGNGTDAYLILGSNTGASQATITGVSAAGTTPYPAGADLNSDGSSDLLLVPTAASSQAADTASDGLADLPPTWVPRLPEQTLSTFVGSNNWPTVSSADGYVNGDGVCHGLTPCYTTIQAAVDAWNDDDLIIVQPGVYAPFFIDGLVHSYNRITIRGTDPDAVFVDANGGSYATRIRMATGVRLENMTLRNASYGVQLDDAGLNGHEVLSNRTILDHLLIYDVTTHDVYMSHSSSVSVTHSTLVRNNQHFGTFGPADPNITVQWSAMDNSPWPIFDGGGAVAVNDIIYFEMGGGNSGFARYHTPSDTWIANPWGPDNLYKPNSTIAAGSDEQVYLLGAPHWTATSGSPNWVVDDFATAPNGDVYAAGWFSSPSSSIAKWDGSSWTGVGSGVLDCEAVAVDQSSGDVYCGGYLTIEKWNGSSWTDLDPAFTGWIYDIAVDSNGNLYVGGDFSTIGGQSAEYAAKWNGSSWSSMPGLDDIVTAMAVDLSNDTIYIGGDFTIPGDGFAQWAGYGWVSNAGVAGGSINAIEVGPDGEVYIGGSFTGTLKYSNPDLLTPAGVASWSGSAWTTYPEVVNSSIFANAFAIAVTDGGELYAAGYWKNFAEDFESFIRWTGTGWEGLNDGFAHNSGKVIYSVGASEHGVFIGGDFNFVGPSSDLVAANYLGLLQFSHEVYSPTLNSWSAVAGPPMSLQDGASYAGDSDGNLILLVGGGRKDSFMYDIATDSWTKTGDMPHAVNASAMTMGENGDIYAVTDGSSSFYKFDGSSWTAIGASISSPAIADGVALAFDSHLENYYVLPGGNGTSMLRYNSSVGSWVTLPVGRNTPAGVRPGASLVFVAGEDENKLYTPQGNYEGDNSMALWMYPLPLPNKVGLEYTVIYAQTASTWMSLSDPMREDFNFRVGPTTLFFGGNGWTPTSKATLPETSADPFLDASRDLYRMGEVGYNIGYHTYMDTITATTSTGIQAAINSGSNRVIVKPGVYEEDIYLVNGVELIGSNPDWTIIRPLSGSTANALVRSEGASGGSLSRFTLDGQNSGLDGFAATDNAAYVTLQRVLIYDTDTAIVIDGAGSDLEVANATIAQNVNGLAATNCASVDVRNTIFAFHTGNGLSHEACATVKLHTYNLYWANADDFGVDADAGAAELFLDPNFVDPMDHDYRTLNFSPIIDAGNPTDPAPPGAGSRADIGYIEQGRVNFYVDDNYCEACINDGLTWQVDAFDVIQDALDAAHNTILDLNPSYVDVPQLVVGVAPGTFNEEVTIPSHVLLIGSGAEVSIIDAGGSGTAVSFASVTDAGVRNFTLMNATTAISVTGASNTIAIERNIIRSNTTGVVVSSRATTYLDYNTLVDNTTGVLVTAPGSWAELMNNIVANNTTGLHTQTNGQIYTDFNLYDNSTNFIGVIQGPDDLVGQGPGFAGGTYPYRLSATSPALDAASPFTAVPNGGGTQADMGYSELLAAPITLLLGQEDLSTVMGNSGVAFVEYGVVQITDTTSLVTDTLPGAWSPITLNTPGETFSYWATNYTPIDEGLYRFYSRATDVVGNQEDEELVWYDGSFVVDSTAPAVTWLAPANSASLQAPLELRAQVSDYAAGEFSVEEKDVYFEIDGQRIAATWAAEPWDESTGEPRVFRAWVTPTVALHSTVIAGAEDKAGNSSQDNSLSFTVTAVSAPDTTPPTVTVSLPANGSWVTHTVLFSGTVSDLDSGVASVEVSVDGGATWRAAAISGTVWSLAWNGPAEQPLISYPAQVRAADRAGHITKTAFQFSVDEVPPEGLIPVVFSAPEGTHFDIATDLTITWTAPIDASGIVTTFVTIDQITDTLPTTEAVSNTAVYNLNSNGPWYIHLAAVDVAGNGKLEHFGPWYVGIDEGLDFGLRQQSIIIDGFVDTKNDEWQLDTEFLDDDERTIGSEVTYSPGGRQSFLTTWDANSYYMAWRGGWWALDGDLWIYVNSGGGGTNQLIVPLANAPAATLPFDADYAIQISDEISGTLYEYSSGWQVSAETWEFAHGNTGDTEIRLPLFGTSNIETLAFGFGDNQTVWAIFPATNPLNPGNPSGGAEEASFFAQSEPMAAQTSNNGWEAYHWDDITTVTNVAANQPIAIALSMEMVSPQSSQILWGPGSTIKYVVTVDNQESETLNGQQITFTASPNTGLIHDTIMGATCGATNPWTCTIDPLAPGETTLTLTTHLVSDLSGISNVMMVAALQDDNIPPELRTDGMLIHQTDSEAPVVTVSSEAFVGVGAQHFEGTATDGNGIGVDFVEVRPENGSWQRVEGTEFWSADLTVSPFAQHGDIWRFDVRATDFYGQVSTAQEVTFTVDLQGSVITLNSPTQLSENMNDIFGSVLDAPTSGETAVVQVQVDSQPWRDALVFAPNESGEQTFLWTWNTPTEDGITHTLSVQAVDLAGNTSTLGTLQDVWVDNVAPVLTVTAVLTQVAVQHYYPNAVIGTPILYGSMSDGSGIGTVSVRVEVPNGTVYEETAVFDTTTWSYKPQMTLLGDYRMLVKMWDTLGNQSQSEYYLIHVLAAPDSGPNTFMTTEDTPITFEPLVNDSDMDSSEIFLDAVADPANGTAAISLTNWVVYTPTLNFYGIDVFTYTVSDGLLFDIGTVTVTVLPVNDAPVLSGSETVTATMSEDGSAISFDFNSSEVDGDTLSWSIVQGTGTAVVFNTSGTGNITATIAFTPQPDFNGLDSFTVRVSDNQYYDTATVEVTITAVDDAPRGTDDYLILVPGDSGSSFTVDLLGNDDEVDNQSLILAAIGTPDNNGAAAINGDLVVYTPTLSLSETETMSYTISDGVLTDTAVLHTSVVAGNASGQRGESMRVTSFGSNNSMSMTISIPNNVLAGNENLSLILQETAVSGSAPGGFKFAGLAFTLKAYEDGILMSSPYTFANPITIIIDYTNADVAHIGRKDNALELRYWNGSKWLSDGITLVQLDTVNNRIVVTIDHLTEFALFGGDMFEVYLPFLIKP